MGKLQLRKVAILECELTKYTLYRAGIREHAHWKQLRTRIEIRISR